MATSSASNKASGKDNKGGKAQDWAETGPVETKAEEKAPEAPAAAAETPKKKKKGQRTPLATRLAAAPTPARKAIIVEEQLKMIQRRKTNLLKLVPPEVLAEVDPALRG